MSTRLNDPKTGAFVLIMQRVHERDLAGHVLEQGGWDHLCLPAEYEPRASMCSVGLEHDKRKDFGELLWPARYGQSEIAELKLTLGSHRAAGQLQQRPAPAGGGVFKAHWWRFWHHPDKPLPAVPVRTEDGSLFYRPCVPLPELLDEVIQSWDLSFKDTKSADFVVGQTWGRNKANKFLLDQKRGRLAFPETCQAISRCLSSGLRRNLTC